MHRSLLSLSLPQALAEPLHSLLCRSLRVKEHGQEREQHQQHKILQLILHVLPSECGSEHKCVCGTFARVRHGRRVPKPALHNMTHDVRKPRSEEVEST